MSAKTDPFEFVLENGAGGMTFQDMRKHSGQRDDLTKFEPSRTRQEFADECDINTIMAQYERSGAISHVNKATPMYLDTTGYPDLQASMDLFREASLAFAALPAVVRREFDNDPQKFVDFASEAENLPRMREWGLAPPEVVPEPPFKVEVVNPAPSLVPTGEANKGA